MSTDSYLAQGRVVAPTVAVEHLTKRYADTVAVDDLTFSIRPGSIAGFLGPNGAGKTTTFRMLVGLATPTEGTAQVMGQPYAAMAQPLRRVGAMLEVSGYHPTRTARNHLRLPTNWGTFWWPSDG